MYVAVNSTRIWFDVEGLRLVPDGSAMRERPTVVLLHGGPGSFDHSYFKPDFARLTDVAQVVYLDLPGHGRSDWGDPVSWTLEKCADDVFAFCNVLEIANPVVLGHSLGGMVAMLYAVRHPDHAGALVLLSTMARFDLHRTVETFRRIGGDEVAGVVQRVYGGGRLSVSPEEWAPCWRLFGPWVIGDEGRARTIVNRELNVPGLDLMRRFDVRDQLVQITCPTLVVTGEVDPITPPEAAREIVASLGENVAHLKLTQRAGHFPWKDEPERFWPVISRFVSTALLACPASA